MKEMTGQWFIVEGAMNYMGVNQVLEFQRHGDHRKFGEIALSRHLINGNELKSFVHSLR
jgi:hypothetical protein